MDLTIKGEDYIFNFRVCAFITNNNKLLLQKTEGVDYYVLEGGRVKFGEDTISALIREIKEETGVVLNKEDLKLSRVIENFFEENNKKYHELMFVYLVDNNKELNDMDNFKTLDNSKQINKWIEIKELNNIKILPKVTLDLLNDKEFKRILNVD